MRRTWGAGLALYLLLGLLAFAIMPLYAPWLGTIFLVVCVAVHVERQKADDPVLLTLAAIQLALTVLTGFLLTPNSSPRRWAFDLSFFLAVLLPLFAGTYAAIKSGPNRREDGPA